jgi:hypothetical protein
MIAAVDDFSHAAGMTEKQLSRVRARLERFLAELVEPMGRSERRHWAQVYIQGLLLDGARKSVQPIAERIAGADVQALNQFLNQSPWEVTEIQRRLARRLAEDGAEPVYWIIRRDFFSEGRRALRRGRPAILRGVGQDRQLSGGRKPALEPGGGELPGELAAVPAAGMD